MHQSLLHATVQLRSGSLSRGAAMQLRTYVQMPQ
jgi:hypothetical protein